jgi:hypothetical protein
MQGVLYDITDDKRFPPARPFCSSTAANLRSRRVLPSCEVTASRYIPPTACRQHAFCGNRMSMT